MRPPDPPIAFQGERGAFSDAAARDMIPGMPTRGYPTFDEAAESAASGQANSALLPVENSIAGPIARTYDILWEHPELHVVDETVHRVQLALIAPAGSDEAAIREVRSHPVALEQVRGFLRGRDWRAVVVHDTAGAVAQIAALNDPAVAAIGPEIAAELYGATILRHAIQDDAQNFTRFFLLSARPEPRRSLRRACIGFELNDRPGALRDALGVFADRALNLRSLVSRPDRKTPFRYRFYCEIGEVDAEALPSLLAALDGQGRVLGAY
jgi:prephenate dehydratase